MPLRYLSDIFSGNHFQLGRDHPVVSHSPEGPAGRREATMRKHPAEEKAVKLLRDGLSDQDVAKRVKTTANHIWALRVYYHLKPVTEKQQAIAKAIVARKRREASP